MDTVAVGDYLAREFGGGGGSELQNLGFLEYLEAELTAKGDVHAACRRDRRSSTTPAGSTTRPRPRPSRPGDRPSTAASGRPPAETLRHRAIGRRTLASAGPGQPTLRVSATATLAADRQLILKTGISLRVLSHGGSNAIVVAPWRSADHHALLWGAPQEGFGTPSVDGEEYLHGARLRRRRHVHHRRAIHPDRPQRRHRVDHDQRGTRRPAHLRGAGELHRPARRPTCSTASGNRCRRSTSRSPWPARRRRASPSTAPSTGRSSPPTRRRRSLSHSRFASWNRETGSLAGFSAARRRHRPGASSASR